MKRNLEIGDVFFVRDSSILHNYVHYVVILTAFKGGGEGHGGNDIYPNGHHVRAISIDAQDDEEYKGEFYQSGSFTNMIIPDEIIWVGRAKSQWTRIS